MTPLAISWPGSRLPRMAARVPLPGGATLASRGDDRTMCMTGTTMRDGGVPAGTLLALMLAVFTVGAGYGLLLPLLPYLIERLLGSRATEGDISWHTGLLTSVYTLAIFLFAPVWGWFSDRYGRRRILLIGLLGFGASMLVFSFTENLPAIYAERFVSGLFAAAVTPVASATIGDLALTEEVRARRLTFVSLAGVSGLLLGPMLGVLIARVSELVLRANGGGGALAAPLTGAAILAFLAAVVAASTIVGRRRAGSSRSISPLSVGGDPSVVRKLLVLAFIVAAGIGVFEVSLALRGKQELGLTQSQVALMFTECSLVMVAVQAIVFSPWIKPEVTRWLLLPALAVFAAGLFLAPRAAEFTLMLTIVAAVAASAGILSPVLTYWISRNAGRTQGMQLGKQSAATALGTAAGSAIGGLLFGLTFVPDAAFLLTTAAVVFGILLSVGLPSQLIAQRLGAGVYLGGASNIASNANDEVE